MLWILLAVVVIYLAFKFTGLVVGGVAGFVGGWDNLLLIVIIGLIIWAIYNNRKGIR